MTVWLKQSIDPLQISCSYSEILFLVAQKLEFLFLMLLIIHIYNDNKIVSVIIVIDTQTKLNCPEMAALK